MRYALLLTLLSLSGCSLFDGGGLEVNTDPPALVLDNTSGQAIYYLAIEGDLAARTNIRFGEMNKGPSVKPGETLRLPYDVIGGYDAGDAEVIVYWSFGDGTIHSRSVRL